MCIYISKYNLIGTYMLFVSMFSGLTGIGQVVGVLFLGEGHFSHSQLSSIAQFLWCLILIFDVTGFRRQASRCVWRYLTEKEGPTLNVCGMIPVGWSGLNKKEKA